MRKIIAAGLLIVSGMSVGCARPFEIGASPTMSFGERWNLTLRNWDLEGKMTQDDIDDILMIRTVSGNTPWNIR